MTNRKHTDQLDDMINDTLDPVVMQDESEIAKRDHVIIESDEIDRDVHFHVSIT